MESRIGRLEKVSMGELGHEQFDFSAWLADNIEILGEELGIRLSAEEIETEKRTGSFYADILARDSSGDKVVIENQLTKTDHDHLGKLITYSSNHEAKTAVWIACDPRPEHITAVAWLNSTTPKDIAFYLVKLSAVRIDESRPAPLFTLLVGPSAEAKAASEEKRRLAESDYTLTKFWLRLLERSSDRGFRLFDRELNPSHQPVYWMWASSGRNGIGYQYLARLKKPTVIELYIDVGDVKANESIFDGIYRSKDEIQKAFDSAGERQLEWDRAEGKRLTRIRYTLANEGINDEAKWDVIIDDMIDAMQRLYNAISPHVNNLPT